MITLRTASSGNPAVTLRPVTPDDAAALGAAFAAMAPWSSYPMTAASLSAFFATRETSAPRHAIYLGDRRVGGAAIRLDWMRGPYLQLLGILPESQRSGIGGLFLTWFELAARARGDRNLWVAVSDFNAGAERLYARFGYERVADLPDLLRDGRTEILLRKRIHLPSA